MRYVTRLLALSLILAANSSAAAPKDTSQLTLNVLTEADNKPVANAHIVVRFVSGKKFFIKDQRTSWETQTNRKGEVVLDDVPLGHIKVQVIARGYQTFGNEFELTKPEEQLKILLKPPAKQVSAY